MGGGTLWIGWGIRFGGRVRMCMSSLTPHQRTVELTSVCLENSATAEVAEILGSHPAIIEANVYGVKVPNHEGRAGCAALQLSPSSSTLDTADLARFARARLPKYAVPVFLRIVTNSTHTDNHKQGKVGLREEGVDPGLIGTKVKGSEGDKFLWLEPGSEQYREFRETEWKGIVEGRVRL